MKRLGCEGIARTRHCERKRSNPALNANGPWIASSLALLAMTQGVSFSRCTCIRVVVTPAMRSHEVLALRIDLRQKAQAVGASAVTINASSHECKRKKKKESGTPKNADPYPLYLAVQLAPCKARSPIGVPPRLSPKGVIVPKAQLQARLPGTWSERALPAIACPSPASTSRPGHNAGRLMPKPPGSGSDEPPPAAPRPAPINQGHRLTSFTANGSGCRFLR